MVGARRIVKPIKFSVDNKTFFCHNDFINHTTLDIKSTPKNYNVIIDENDAPFVTISSVLQKNKKNILLIDANILKIYNPTLNIEPEKIFIIEATENYKTLESVTKLLNFMQKNEITKSEQLVVVGGGITQEIGAFTCAIYKRGLSWIYFPTTLLSMCDSCIGGKASLNYNGAKNQLGLFSTPSEVYINYYFLKTLTECEINSGLGEILKSCIIGGDYFTAFYQENVINGKVKSLSSFKSLIMASLMIKKIIVEADEFESNERRSLNYGHTFGHAIEALSDYKIPHGQAVIAGMVLANKLSHKQGMLSENNLIILNQLCFDLINNTVLSSLKNYRFEDLIDLIQKDKKTAGNQATFVMIKSPGDVYFVKQDLKTLQFTW